MAPTAPLTLTVSTDPTIPPIVAEARRLAGGDSELLRGAAGAAGGLAVNLAVAAVILLVTLWEARWLSALTAGGIARAHRRDPADTTLQAFAASLVRYLVVAIGLVAVLDQLGVKATSVIAVLGAASLAIGLALQGALSNVAAGVMILILRPYRVGDRVEIDGRQGIVRRLDLFVTRISDPDNLNVYIPNGKAFGAIIVNQTQPVARRAQLDFTIDYDDDVDRALELLLACAKADPRVVAKPEPWARLTALQASGVQVTLRAWFSTTDYWDGRFDLIKAVKDAFDAEGITFPYPHQVAVEARRFEPPHSEPSAAKPLASKARRKGAPARPAKAVSPRSASPRPTRAGSSQGR